MPRVPVIHLGSLAHERWSVQTLALAVTDEETSVEEASRTGLRGRHVMCWSPTFWRELPDEHKRCDGVICFFHHGGIHFFDDPQIIAAVCMNSHVAGLLRRRQPDKPVRLVEVGGVEAAVPHARRTHPTDKIRLLMTGYAGGRMTPEAEGPPTTIKRKGVELIQPIADRLDRERYAWVFVGKDWEGYAADLRDRGFTVICPGFQDAPAHYIDFGEGDIHLMMSRLEGGPLTLLEAMGLGMWTITTPVGIARDLVVHGVNGHLLRPFDGEGIPEHADEVASHVLSLDQAAMVEARPRIQRSVEHRTWANFKTQVDAVIDDVFNG